MDMYDENWSPAVDLEKDKGGHALKEMLDFLRQRQADLKASLDKGVTPEEFKRGQELLGSYDAAARGLERSWRQRNGS